MLKFAIAFILCLSASNFANAHNLDPKWAHFREQANSLADKAKNGNADAFVKLLDLANTGYYAPAMNKMGWLYQHGYFVEKNQETACEWFNKAANPQQYPPAMHNYAKCLFMQTDEPFNEVISRQLMIDAAQAGWTNSAIVLSKKMLEGSPVSSNTASQAFDLSLNALRDTSPSKDEAVTLYYFVGQAAALGPQNRRLYRIGHDALSIALPSGHPKASATLTQLETVWGTAVQEDIERFSLYEDSRMKRMANICYKRLAKENVKAKQLKRCKRLAESRFASAQQLSKDAHYLAPMIFGEVGNNLRSAIREFEVMLGPYKTAHYKWTKDFIPLYEALSDESSQSP